MLSSFNLAGDLSLATCLPHLYIWGLEKYVESQVALQAWKDDAIGYVNDVQ